MNSHPRPALAALWAQLAPASLLALLASCGGGTAILASSGSSSSSDAAPSVGSGLELTSTKTSPALVRFELLDAEGDSADVRILVRANQPGAAFRTGTLVDGAFTAPGGAAGQANRNLSNLGASNAGQEHFKLWDFAADGLGQNGQESIVVRVETTGGGANEAVFNVGNDAPTGTLEAADSILTGISLLSLSVLDSDPDEEVQIEIQFREIVDEPSEDCWLTARRAGATGDDFVDTSADGETEDFFWDTDADLASADDTCIDLEGRAADVEVRMVITELPASPEDVGAIVFTDAISVRVDNNSDPVAIFENDLFVINPDGRRGIPIPFTVLDEEGHDVDVAIQWRRENESFPPLIGVDQDATVEQLRALLTDPDQAALRRELQIAGELPLYFEGLSGALPGGFDPDHQIRLPQLGSTALPVTVSGLEGLELQILRGNRSPLPVELPNGIDLSAPVGIHAVPASAGTEAYVLDRDGSGWRLRRLDVDPAPGESGQTLIAMGSGLPLALAVSPDQSTAFVASDAPLVHRVDLASGTVEASLSIPGPARDLAASSAFQVYGIACPTPATCTEPGLIRLDFNGTPRVADLSSSFEDAHGIAIDPLRPQRAYVAETGRDRILAVNLETLERRVLATSPLSSASFVSPRHVTVEETGRLLVTTVQGSATSLVALDLRAPQDVDGDDVADPLVYPVIDLGGLAEADARISAGPEGVRWATLPASNQIAAGGGTSLRRPIEGFDATNTVVTVGGSELPTLRPSSPWRIARRLIRPRSDANGAKNIFLWDSSEVAGGGRVRLRIVALDSDIGDVSEGLSSKEVRAPLNNTAPLEAAVSPGEAEVRAIALGDLDGDGDLDVVSADFQGGELTGWNAHYQEWSVDPETLIGSTSFRSEVEGASTLDRPRSIATGDLNGDGLLDVVVTNTGDAQLIPFFQTAAETFVPAPITMNGSPWTVVVADMDSDGNLDLVAGCRNEIRIRYGAGDGTFDDELRLIQVDRRPRGLEVVDINADGVLDVVAANEFTSTFSIFRGVDGRSFAPLFELELMPGLENTGADGLSVTDLDNDGDLDVVVTNTNEDVLSLFEQTSTDPNTLTFDGPYFLGDINSTSQTTRVVAADFDGDGYDDLLTVNANGVQRSLTIFYQRPTGDPGFQFELDANGAFNAVADSFQPLDVVVDDIDGDGGLDIVFGDEGREVVIYLNEVLGRFTPDVNGPLSDPLLETAPIAVVAGDSDRDGNKDLIVANRDTDSIAIFRQEAPGIFNASSNTFMDTAGTSLVQPIAVEFVDLDGDSFGDIVYAARGDDGVTSLGSLGVFYGAEGGEYGDATPLHGPSDLPQPANVRLADLDRDGDLDVVFITNPAKIASSVGFFEQTASRTFVGPTIILPDVELATGLRLEDVDRDGFVDILYLNRCLQRGVYHRGIEGPIGSFAAPTMFGEAALVDGTTDDGGMGPDLWMPSGLELDDIDGDGDIDILATSTFFRTASDTCLDQFQFDEDRPGILIFYQDLDAYPDRAGFGATPDFLLDGPTLPEVPRGPRMMDFDLDGDLDIVSVDQRQVTTYLHATPRHFVRNQVLLPTVDAGSYNSLITEDLDGDGDRDLGLASFRLDFVRVLFGNH